MSKLSEQIKQDLVKVMKSKDAETTSVLRMLIAAVHNKEIALRDKGAVELSDEQALEVVSSEIKKRRDSVEAYAQGGRQDLVDKETSEIKILEKYLPEQTSDEELEKIIAEVIAVSAADFGRVMGQVMARELVKKMLVKKI